MIRYREGVGICSESVTEDEISDAVGHGAACLVVCFACALALTRFIGETGIFFGKILAWAGADILLL